MLITQTGSCPQPRLSYTTLTPGILTALCFPPSCLISPPHREEKDTTFQCPPPLGEGTLTPLCSVTHGLCPLGSGGQEVPSDLNEAQNLSLIMGQTRRETSLVLSTTLSRPGSPGELPHGCSTLLKPSTLQPSSRKSHRKEKTETFVLYSGKSLS